VLADDRSDGGPLADRRVAGRARRRRRLGVLQPRERRRLVAGQGVLRPQRRPDPEDLVGDGDRALRHGSGVRAADRPRDLGGAGPAFSRTTVVPVRTPDRSWGSRIPRIVLMLALAIVFVVGGVVLSGIVSGP